MAKDVPKADLDRPADEACRRLAREHLELAAAACGRLSDPEDTEALHDFRVALRRLRGTLRAFSKPLDGSVGKKWVQRISDLAGRTGDGRDAEVALAWVEAQRPHLNWRQRRGLDWYAERLGERKERGYAKALRGVPDRFAKLAGRLRSRLQEPEDGDLELEGRTAGIEVENEDGEAELGARDRVGEIAGQPARMSDGRAAEREGSEEHDIGGRPVADEHNSAAARGTGEADAATQATPTQLSSSSSDSPADPEPPPEPFALALAAAARDRATRLVERLGALGDAGDERGAHRARIAAKRLRYILEPVAHAAPEARSAVRALKRLQDLLGDLHDAHVLEHELTAALEEAASARAGELLDAALDSAAGTPRPPGGWDVVGGLVVLAGLNRTRRDRLYASLRRNWLAGSKTADLAAKVGGLAARLEVRAVVPGVAVSRLERMAAEALDEYRAGRTEELGFDEL